MEPPPPQVPVKEILEPPPKIPERFAVPPPILSGSGGGQSQLLGETKGFFGNVPQDTIIGIFGKRQEVTYSEGAGLFAKSKIKQKKERSPTLGIFAPTRTTKKKGKIS